jgi:hypothetical protein
MKILQITTYDLDKRDHGGRLRAFHIRDILRRQNNVQTLCFDWGDVEDFSSLKVVLDRSKWSQLGIDRLRHDWAINLYLDNNEKVFNNIANQVGNFAPDMLLLEGPFLWPMVQRLLSVGALSASTPVIYSSQNIEVALKSKIYNDSYPNNIANRYTQIVDEIEKGIINYCSASLAVSENDAAYIRDLCPEKPLKIYLNGHTPPQLNQKSEKWRTLFSTYKTNWVFVASRHVPNVNGLLCLIEAMPAKVSDHSFALWVFGEVGSALLERTGFKHSHYPWVQILGHMDSQDIDAAILESTGLTLPIWEGGGSNLKTAQALLSGKCIIGSKFSFRGFEQFTQENGVRLEDSPNELAQALLDTGSTQMNYVRGQRVNELEWSTVLATLPQFMDSIYNKNRPKKSTTLLSPSLK